jgi:hypothetical protein
VNDLPTRLWRLGKPFQWQFLWLVIRSGAVPLHIG